MHPEVPGQGDLVEGRYKVEKTLGVGGMAVVLAAHDELLDKAVAVKLLSPDAPKSGTIVERFQTEARSAAKMHSPHVAKVLDVGTLPGGTPFMVMERLDGCDLEELVALERRLAVADAVDYILQALHGLANAHALGIVHRDLKPANLFLAHLPDGTNIIKVLDFGVAKLTEPGGKAVGAVTMEGVTVGSPMYMSPEQVRSSKSVDHRTDLWALGAVLYELLTGQPPFTGEGVGEIFAAVLEKTPTSIRALRPEVPEALEAAVMRCMDRDVDRRFADAAAVARALAPFGTGRWASLVQTIAETLARRGMTTASRAFQPVPMPIHVLEGADTSPVTTGVATLDAPKAGGRRWPWVLAAAVGVAVVAIAAVRYTNTTTGASAPKPVEVAVIATPTPTTATTPATTATSVTANAATAKAGTVKASATPSPSHAKVATPPSAGATKATLRPATTGNTPRPKSSRPAILDSPY